MRSLYLVSYDVCHPKRLRRVYVHICGFGEWVQYSVFLCRLNRMEKIRLLDQIGRLIKLDEDRVMIVDLGPAEGRGADCVEFLGQKMEFPGDGPIVL